MSYRRAMSQELIRRVESSPYLLPDFSDNIGLNNCKRVHEAYERIFINIAANKGCKWQDIYNALPRNTEYFIDLCIGLILLERCLKNKFKLGKSERDELLGARLNDILKSYKIALESKF